MSSDKLADAMVQLQAGSFNDIAKMLNQMERHANGKPPEMSDADKEKRQMVAAAMADFSKTPGGIIFFEEMINKTFWRMSYPAGLNDLSRDQRADYGSMREGQNGFAYQLLCLVSEGLGNPPPPNREVL